MTKKKDSCKHNSQLPPVPALGQSFVAAVDPETLGYQLKMARKAAGFTQEQVAEAMNTKDSAIRRIENSKNNLRMDTIKNYAAAIGYNVNIEFTPEK